MRTLIATLVAVLGLAVPAAALAHGDHHGHHGFRLEDARFFEVGSGSSLTNGTLVKGKPFATGTWTANVAVTGAATAHGSCAAAAGSVVVTGTGTTSGTLTESVKGKLCTPSGDHPRLKSVFVGRFTVTGATGAAASLHGASGLVVRVQKLDGSVRFFELVRGAAHGDNDDH